MKEPTINRILGINATRRGLIKTENSFIFSSANNLNLEGKIITFSNSISCLSLKHDLVAIGFKGVNANLAILNLKNSAILSQFKGHKFGVEAASFSPSNSTIVSIGQDNVIHLWDYILNVKLASCKLSIHLNSICFHPSGTFFITSGLNHIKYWFISPDSVKIEGKYAVMGDHKNSDFLDLSCLITQEKTNIYTITKSALLILFGESRLMEKWVELKADYGTCITTCDKFIICGCSNSIIRLFQPDSLLYIATLPKPHLNTNSYPDTVSLSIDSTCTKLSVIYSDHSLFTWDLSDIKNITAIDSQLFQKDCIWGVETHPKFTWNSVNLNQDIPQNSFVTYSSDGTAMFWNLESPNQPFKIIYLESGIRSLKISNDGKWMVTGDKSGLVSIHDLSSFSLYKSIQAHEGEILAIDFSLQHDDPTRPNLMATSSRDRSIHVYDINQNFTRIQTLDDHSSSITRIKFCENGTKLISSSFDKSILFRHESNEANNQYVAYHTETSRSTVYDLDIDASQKFIASVSDKRINVYGTTNGKLIKSYKPDQYDVESNFIKISLDPSGLYCATASSDKQLRIFDFYTGSMLFKMNNHCELITGLSFSRNGANLISTSNDCIIIWNLPETMVKQIQNRLGKYDDVDYVSVLESAASSNDIDDVGLPSWAKSDYDPDKSPIKKPVRNPIRVKGVWAERVEHGIEFFKRVGDTLVVEDSQDEIIVDEITGQVDEMKVESIVDYVSKPLELAESFNNLPEISHLQEEPESKIDNQDSDNEDLEEEIFFLVDEPKEEYTIETESLQHPDIIIQDTEPVFQGSLNETNEVTNQVVESIDDMNQEIKITKSYSGLLELGSESLIFEHESQVDEEDAISQDVYNLNSLAKHVTKRLVDKLNVNERSSINMQEMYNVLINVRDQTMVAIEKIEPFVDKKVKEIEINQIVNDGRLKLILETYSDILVSIVKEKLGS